jgi:hypothetical protein
MARRFRGGLLVFGVLSVRDLPRTDYGEGEGEGDGDERRRATVAVAVDLAVAVVR